PQVQLSNFVVTYTGFTPQAQAAFQAAVNIWATQVQSSVPIRVNAVWASLGGGGILGQGGAAGFQANFAGATQSNTWYPNALANAIAGVDLAAGQDDLNVTFNNDFPDWYFGTDGQPGGTLVDFESVVLHEMGHALGFIGSMRVSGSIGSWGSNTPYPFIY